ncbi:MAG: hypothetical protein ACJ71Y_01180 [Blastococcus sp.]
MTPAKWRVWAGPVGGWHRFDVLAALSPEARDLYAELLALSTPIDRVTALPGAGWHSSRQASVSMLELERRTGHRLSRLYFARHELEHAGLVQVLTAGGFGGRCNIYAVTCGGENRVSRWS